MTTGKHLDQPAGLREPIGVTAGLVQLAPATKGDPPMTRNISLGRSGTAVSPPPEHPKTNPQGHHHRAEHHHRSVARLLPERRHADADVHGDDDVGDLVGERPMVAAGWGHGPQASHDRRLPQAPAITRVHANAGRCLRSLDARTSAVGGPGSAFRRHLLGLPVVIDDLPQADHNPAGRNRDGHPAAWMFRHVQGEQNASQEREHAGQPHLDAERSLASHAPEPIPARRGRPPGPLTAAATAAPSGRGGEPIGVTATWRTVARAFGWRCSCTGVCGRTHARTEGRCPAESPRERLYAAPSDLAVPEQAAHRVPVGDLALWCGPCLDSARRRTSMPAPAAGEALFDLLGLKESA